MVGTEPLLLHSEAQEWAVRTLDIHGEPSSLSLLTALRWLDCSNYIHPSETVEALRIIANPLTIPDWISSKAREQKLAEIVSQFARTFFEVPSNHRQAKLTSLYEECKDMASLRIWLDQLRQGLEVGELPHSTNDDMNRLIKACCDAFAARPPVSIRRRHAVVMMCRTEEATWNNAIEELRSGHAQFVNDVVPWMNEQASEEIGLPSNTGNVQKKRRRRRSFNEWANSPHPEFYAAVVFLMSLIGITALAALLEAVRSLLHP